MHSDAMKGNVMSPTHRNQVMPNLSPAEYAALKTDIAANGVRIPIEVDEEGNIIDGFHRKQICGELGIECPTRPFFGRTEEQKRAHAWQVNLTRRHLSQDQKREIARTLREEGWSQQRIAQALAIRQATVSRWIKQFIQMDQLAQPDTIQGSDGKSYSSTRRPRRTAQPTEGGSIPDSRLGSDADDRSPLAPEQGEPPRPRGAIPETRSPSKGPTVASDAPESPGTPPPVTNEFQGEAREQSSSALELGPVPPAEDDAEAHWVGALQDLSAKLDTLRVQGGSLPPSTRWAPETKARGMATIRHMKEILALPELP
jgi:transposase-like protein